MDRESHTNRLIGETSPYLLQHAHNPVDWYPWGEEALERARREDKPILLSIGYSACHWCHVMERECFEDEGIASLMNQDFVSIKVDREEHPDLDAVYMEAVQAMTGRGGWPLTVFLTPQGKPFYGGTYFPPEDRQGLPGFPRVLRAVAQTYASRREEAEAAAERVVSRLKQALQARPGVQPLTSATLSTAFAALKAAFDPQNGGFGSAPKFPQPMVLEFLLRYHRRSGDRDALLMLERTLERMARGGIYDQIGGGFHRYSVDARWLVPHFEKMLYDNALLSHLYLHAYQATGRPLYRRIVEETLDYVLREMRGSEGGFYSTQDADSEGIEGKYYTWTLDELTDVLGEGPSRVAARYFGITGEGNFEGANVLSQTTEVRTLASELGLSPAELEGAMATARARLLERRASRVPPHRDEKALADWNGLMLASLAEAASVLDREDYLQAAISCASFLTQSLYDGKTLRHSYKDGRTKGDGYLQDYAFLCVGLLLLHQATLGRRWLRSAIKLGEATLERFWDESGGCFYDTPHGQRALVVRPSNIYDNAVPSGAAAATLVLLRLARVTGNADCQAPAAASLRSVQELMSRHPLGFGHWLCALDFYLSEPREIAIVGRPGDPATISLIGAVAGHYLPNTTVVGRDPDEPGQTADIPLLQGRFMIENRPAVYPCENYVCQTPIGDLDVLTALLDQW